MRCLGVDKVIVTAESKKNSLWGKLWGHARSALACHLLVFCAAPSSQGKVPRHLRRSPPTYTRGPPTPLCLLFALSHSAQSSLSTHIMIHCVQVKGKFGQYQNLQERDLIKLKRFAGHKPP
ncbi:hypothetical protein BC826DRAFT_599171 [Russula brevipes]|nr:hypothetical protein BC826DRAFT_599171 [Russula brevipes]